MNQLFVDGYNLLHRDRDLATLLQRDPAGARERLLAWVSRWAVARRAMATVVFDGGAGPGPAPGEAPSYRVAVIFAPNADAYLRGVIERSAGDRSLAVVTSDEADIGRYARACGVVVIAAESFLERMRLAREGRSQGSASPEGTGEGEKPGEATPEEVEFWLREFGES